MLRASTEIHVFIVIITALILKNDLSWESVGPEAYDFTLFFSFLLLVPFAAFLAVLSKLLYVRRLLQDRGIGLAEDVVHDRQLSFLLHCIGLAEELDHDVLKRYIEGWAVRGKFACFLSHYKNEAAAEARTIKLEMCRALRLSDDKIFLDADNLTDLRQLLTSVDESDAVVLLYTRGVLSRPWCLLELYAAAKKGVPVVLLLVDNVFADKFDAARCLDDLPAYLAETNPGAEKTLEEQGTTAAEVAAAIRGPLTAAEAITVRGGPPGAVYKRHSHVPR